MEAAGLGGGGARCHFQGRCIEGYVASFRKGGELTLWPEGAELQ